MQFYQVDTSVGFSYFGPLNFVQQVVTGTVVQGAVMQIPHPLGDKGLSAANASWTTKFDGPSLQCEEVTGDSRARVIENILSTIENQGCSSLYPYVSWVPSLTYDDSGLEFYGDNSGLSFDASLFSSNSFETSRSTLSETFPLPFRIYVAAFPDIPKLSATQDYCSEGQDVERKSMNNGTIIACDLWNSSYSVDFFYSNGGQIVNSTILEDFNTVAVDILQGGFQLSATGDYYKNATNIKNYAYMSVMDAFGQVLVGTVHSLLGIPGLHTTYTTVAATALLNTVELKFMSPTSLRREYRGGTGKFETFQDSADFLTAHGWDGSSIETSETPTLRLIDAIERLFQNITVSLIGSPHLQ
ncbi:hypothetical protein ABW19_dt0204868 [Dactylella cylindrospora]|nr:hypothetical protein ABW19_dt0204868 [Dactylella cylindrospora]